MRPFGAEGYGGGDGIFERGILEEGIFERGSTVRVA